MGNSVAFKCTYNNGDEGTFVGFAATCSRDNIRLNIRSQRLWCSNPQCSCRRFYDQGMTGDSPSSPCYESILFKEWHFSAGEYHTGPLAGKKIHINQAEVGKLAILTTRFPGEPESERRIVGLFQIERIEGNHTVFAATRGRIRLPLEEARELFYWAYVDNTSNKPDWRTGLFRYLEDGQVHRILADILSTVRDQRTKAEIAYLIQKLYGDKPAPLAAGCLPEKSKFRFDAVVQLRKYGRGGEGKEHKALKEWIAKHPEIIGLSDVVDVTLEQAFISGDSADLVFRHSSGKHTVVEIETTTPLPGAHQAIKYRVLLAAERGLPLDTTEIDAVLVAWSIPLSVQQFCQKYNIHFYEYMLDYA